MKHVKMLGLAAVAACAMMAIAGVGTASAAGALCSTATNPCTSKWATGTAIDFSLKSGTTAKLVDTSNNTLDSCTTSTVKGTLEKNAGGAASAEGKIGELTWGVGGSCTVTTDTILPGGLKIDSNGAGTGKVSSNAKIEVTVNVFSSCNYGVESGAPLGTTSEGIGTGVVFTANAVAKKLNGGFLCPETTKWTGTYVLTTPSNTTFYVSTS
jgi:hypothetical protein